MDNHFVLHTYKNVIYNQYIMMLVVLKYLWINFYI